METGGGMTSPRVRSAHALPRSPLALPLSLGAHLAVIYVVSRAPWSEIEIPSRSQLRVAWLTMPQPKEPPEPPPQSAVESAPLAPAEPLDVAAPLEEPQAPAPDVQPATAEDPLPVAPPTTAPEVREDRILRPKIDWEELRRDSVVAALENRARTEGRSTFSAGDHIVIAPREEPSPRAEIFNPRGPDRTFGQPSKARTKAGRWFAKMCNMFSGGGFGIPVFGKSYGFCAESNADGGLFADIKPDYLKMMPECFDAGVIPEDGAPPGPLRDPATAKCRLVFPEEP